MNFISIPFAWLLRFFYSFTQNYALALIFFTVIVKLVFSFVNVMQHKSAVSQARIKPKLNAIRKRYVGRTDKYVQIEYQNDLMKLQQEEKLSASSGCLPMLIQLLIVVVLYQIVYSPLTYVSMVSAEDMIAVVKQPILDNFSSLQLSDPIKEAVQSVLNNPEVKAEALSLSEMQLVSVINNNKGVFTEFFANGYQLPNFTMFGGALDLAEKPTFTSISVIIPLLTVIFQIGSIFVTKLVSPKPDTSSPEAAQTAKSMQMTNIIMTLVSGMIAFSFPAIIGIYWIYQSIIGTVITVILHKVMPVPSFTEEEMRQIEEEYNKDYVRPEIPTTASLHFIDEDDDFEDTDDASEATSEPEAEMPKRRLYDKDGNKIRSLHFIDEDDDENGIMPSIPDSDDLHNEKDKENED